MIDWLQTQVPTWFWIAFIVHGVTLLTVAYLILLERKVASWAQDRIGPNRVGLGFGIIPWIKDKKMFGLGQPLADGLKFILKEDYRPRGADMVLFTLAPAIMITVVIVSIAVIPWGGVKETTKTLNTAGLPMTEWDAQALKLVPRGATMVRVEQARDANNVVIPDVVYVRYRYPFQIAQVNIGVLFVLAVLSLAVYGVVIGGWASNNKYSFLGGLRATANMISYEIPLGLSVLCIVLMFGTLDLGTIVTRQTHYWGGFVPAWNVFSQPLAFLLFLVCIHAEANRAPFDVAEAEQELVGGYHTEYSSMRFALFFLAEYAGMITTSCVLVALFFGGWHMPWLEWIPFFSQPADPDKSVTSSLLVCLIRSVVFFGKALAVLFLFMWVRWSLPRFRFDQVMDIAWRALIPMSLALTMGSMLLVYAIRGRSYFGLLGIDAIFFLLMNLAVLGGTMLVSKLLPAPPNTNRKIRVEGSRFLRTPVPSAT